MKATITPNETLARIFSAYQQMPNGGAVLQITDDGKVHNGMAIVETFKSKSSACRQLRMAGFLPLHSGQGWKIYPVANAMNR